MLTVASTIRLITVRANFTKSTAGSAKNPQPRSFEFDIENQF